MNPSEAIDHLKSTGMTEEAIAIAAGSRQSTINRIRNGVLKNPSYELGKRLVGLAQDSSAGFGPAPTQQGEERADAA